MSSLICNFLLSRSARERAIREVIEPMAKDGLRTISLAYRDFVYGKAEINQVKRKNALL